MTVWNSSDKNAVFTLSNSDTTVTKTDGGYGDCHRMARGIPGKASGKWYFETIGTCGNTIVGVAQSGHTLNNYLGYAATGWGFMSLNSRTSHNGSQDAWGTIEAWDDTVVIGVAVDLDEGEIWWSKDGVWQDGSSPATGTNPAYSNLSGTLLPAISMFYVDGVASIRETEADATYDPPEGFFYWDYETVEIEATFPSLSMSSRTPGGPIVAEFRPLSMAGSATYAGPEPIVATFPSFEMSLYAGAGISAPLTSLEADGAISTTRPGNIAAEFPCFDMSAGTGCHAAMPFPMFLQVMSATQNVLADMAVSLPFLSMTGAMSMESSGTIAAILSALRISLTGISGPVGEMETSFKPLSMSGNILPGYTAEFEGAFPSFLINLHAGPTGPAQVAGTLPSLNLRMYDTGLKSSIVLRHNEERIR